MKVSYRTETPEYDYGVRADGSWGKFIYDVKEKIVDYECDREDFIKWFKQKGKEVKTIIVETDKKEIWIWTPETVNKKASGWQYVKKVK